MCESKTLFPVARTGEAFGYRDSSDSFGDWANVPLVCQSPQYTQHTYFLRLLRLYNVSTKENFRWQTATLSLIDVLSFKPIFNTLNYFPQ
jgi:hypothetical protein